MTTIKTFPTLYTRGVRGDIRVWKVEAVGDTIRTTHGKEGCTMTIAEVKAVPKNVGKANETTAEEQACLEAESRWKKQKDKDYHENLSDAQDLKNPMLAKDFNKEGHRISYPCTLQPKLDGVRALVFYDKRGCLRYVSRGGKFYPNIKELDADLMPLFKANPDLMLDGELYCHDMLLQDIVSAVKKHNENTQHIKYYIFDIAQDTSWKDRSAQIEATRRYVEKARLNRVEVVPNIDITCEDDISHHHQVCISDGYEGVILRNHKGKYLFNKRSPDLQKYKVFQDKEYKIIAVEQDRHGHGVCLFDLGDGTRRVFRAKLAGTDKQRLHVWEHSKDYLSKWGTVKFQAFTKDGIPQFPVLTTIRDMKNATTPNE